MSIVRAHSSALRLARKYSTRYLSARTSYSGGGKDYTKRDGLNAACTYLNGTKATKEQIVHLAEYFATWLKGSAPAQVQQAAPAEVPAPAPAPTPAPQVDAWNDPNPTNGLPF